VRRTLLTFLVVLSACDWSDSPATPPDTVQPPQLDVVLSPGDIIGTTNQGELVRIDLGTGTVTLIGDAGAFNGRELGWTGLAFDDVGNLFVSSRNTSELPTDGCTGVFGGGSCSHIYRVDASVGAIVDEVGSTLVSFVSDLVFVGDTLLASAYLNTSGDCCGALLEIDPGTAQSQWVSGAQGFGPNPLSGRPLQNGGLAVHPATGELWGTENNFLSAAMLFRIDRQTGEATGAVRLGLNGTETTFGLDALAILPDGRFMATQGGSGALFEIDPIPDPSSGLAELTAVPLTFVTPLAGHINGLAVMPASPPELTLSCPDSAGLSLSPA
jgi:hypothetical protein